MTRALYRLFVLLVGTTAGAAIGIALGLSLCIVALWIVGKAIGAI